MAAFASSELPARNFQAALAGLIKRNYYSKPGDESLGQRELAEALYGDSGLDTDAAVEHLSCAESLIRKAAFDNWDPTVLEEAAVGAGLAAPLAEVFARVWRQERAKVRGAVPASGQVSNICVRRLRKGVGCLIVSASMSVSLRSGARGTAEEEHLERDAAAVVVARGREDSLQGQGRPQ